MSDMVDGLMPIISEFGTPCYIYDEGLILHNIARFQNIRYTCKSIHFASMANNNPHLLRILKDSDVGIFVNSMKHLSIACQSGFEFKDIIYTTTGIQLADMKFIVDNKIAINLDSINQLETYGRLNYGGSVGVRLNIDERSRGNVFIGSESRIGILEMELPALFEGAARHSLRIIGTHVYLGTNIVSIDEMIAGVMRTLDLSDRFPDLQYVDLGGGFPVDAGEGMSFDYATYSELITQIFEEYSKKRGRDIQLILEPGRALFGDTAVFCTQVIDIKERPDRYLICCDASASIFPRSIFYNEFHDIEVLGKQDMPALSKPSDIVGATTYSRDFLGKNVPLPLIEPGDILLFKNSGSYCYSMLTQFLGQAAPSEILIDLNGSTKLIRERENIRV
jgi:diaminopimelate decarboxylase